VVAIPEDGVSDHVCYVGDMLLKGDGLIPVCLNSSKIDDCFRFRTNCVIRNDENIIIICMVLLANQNFSFRTHVVRKLESNLSSRFPNSFFRKRTLARDFHR
jgi:hypothetical protein